MATIIDERVVIAMDPGQKGAAVMLDMDGQPVEAIAADEPGGYYEHKLMSGGRLAAWLRQVSDGRDVVLVVLEKAQTRPRESTRSALTTGEAYGVMKGVVETLGLPLMEVTPARWCRAIHGQGVKKSADRKARSVRLAEQRMPRLKLTWGRRRKAHDGLADAACIALYARRQVRKD